MTTRFGISHWYHLSLSLFGINDSRSTRMWSIEKSHASQKSWHSTLSKTLLSENICLLGRNHHQILDMDTLVLWTFRPTLTFKKLASSVDSLAFSKIDNHKNPYIFSKNLEILGRVQNRVPLLRFYSVFSKLYYI